MNSICKLAAVSMIEALLIVAPVKAEMTEIEGIITMPTLAIDAERATYQSLISRQQDEVSEEQIQMSSANNPVDMFYKQNSSTILDGGLGGAISAIRVRGLPSMYSNVTVDGISVNSPWTWTSVLSGFPLNRLNKITLSNTGSAMVYGANAVAGSLNYSLPTGADYEGFTLGFEVGGNGKRHQEIIAGINEGKTNHLIALFKDESAGKRRMDNGVIFNDSRNNLAFLYKGEFDLSHGWKYKAMILENDGSLCLADSWGENRKNPAKPYYLGLKMDPWKMSLYSHTLEKQLNEDSNFLLRYTKYSDFSTNVTYEDPMMTKLLGNDGDTKVDLKTYDLIYNTKLNNKNYLNFGVTKQSAIDSHDGVSADHYKEKFSTTSFFIADSINFSDKLNGHLALRSDENLAGERDTSYSFNTAYQITENTSLGLGYSRTLMAPTLQDLYNGKGTFGNPNLKNEKAKNIELRFSHKVSDNWTLSLTGYEYNIADKICQLDVADGSSMIGQNKWFKNNKGKLEQWQVGDSYKANVERAKYNGIELALNGKINDNFNAWLSYTKFGKGEYTEKGMTYDYPNIPTYRAVVGLGYYKGKTSATLSTALQGKMKEISQGTKYKAVKSSIVCDFSIRQQCNEDFSVYLKVNNIGNDKNVVLSQVHLANSAQAKDCYWYEEGRTIIMGVELKIR